MIRNLVSAADAAGYSGKRRMKCSKKMNGIGIRVFCFCSVLIEVKIICMLETGIAAEATAQIKFLPGFFRSEKATDVKQAVFGNKEFNSFILRSLLHAVY